MAGSEIAKTCEHTFVFSQEYRRGFTVLPAPGHSIERRFPGLSDAHLVLTGIKYFSEKPSVGRAFYRGTVSLLHSIQTQLFPPLTTIPWAWSATLSLVLISF